MLTQFCVDAPYRVCDVIRVKTQPKNIDHNRSALIDQPQRTDQRLIVNGDRHGRNKMVANQESGVGNHCPRLLINREKAGHRDRLMRMLGMGGGLDFDSDTNSRDVLWLGDCDVGCQLLADQIGWGVSYYSYNSFTGLYP
ncbi:NAD-dependent protein deacetylase sirtuin-2 [Homalodisca vitripennis]|nr:NAD-dependent protein deacetylase sirtuin-2 [Homalodisca vitripennis]